MKNWCKIIELEEHSVLLQRLSSDEELEQIVLSFKLEGVLVTFKLGYEEDNGRADEAFLNFTKENAEELVKNVTEMYAGQ